MTGSTVSNLTQHWWLLALRGVFAIIFALIAFALPGITLFALAILFGAYALVNGLSAAYTAIRCRHAIPRWWVHLLEGLAGVVAGIVALAMPGLTVLAVTLIVGIWALVTGVLEVLTGIRLRHEIVGEWMLLTNGILSVIVGLLFLTPPLAFVVAMARTLGVYAIIIGVLRLILAVRLHGGARAGTPVAHAPS